MLLPNSAVDQAALGALLAERYGADPAGLAFVPVGGDGWHYRCPPFWVSVRRDRQGHWPPAFDAAAELARSLDFMLAPLHDRSGRVVHEVSGLPVVVLPLVEARTLFESGVRPGEPERIVTLLERLHAARLPSPLTPQHDATVAPQAPQQDASAAGPVERPNDAAAAASLRSETYELPFADELRWALAAAERADERLGPYGAPLRDLVARNHVRIDAMVSEIEVLAAACRADPAPLVLTHGEPNRGNVLRDATGRLLLIDWGDLAFGPPERDWSSLPDFGLEPRGRAPFLRFYALRWELGEIAEYATRFAAPHEGSVEDDHMWRELGEYLR
jgi:hypothetical protein